MSSNGIFSILALLACAISSCSALAQSERGTIAGSVRDASGSVVPAANIKAPNTATNAALTGQAADYATALDGDASPVGHMANVTLDLVSYNFGMQQYSTFNDRAKEIFQGSPGWKDGYLWISEKPGWGIEIDEQAALKAPFTPGRENLNGGWGRSRAPTEP